MPSGALLRTLFFGPVGRELYGVLHLPGGQLRPIGVVLCHSLSFEYMRWHWQLRRVAELLSAQGFAVLRFDWFGTGDSSGNISEARMANWTENVAVAAAELSELAGVARICTAAIGGAAAVLAATSRTHVPSSLLLVDPPLSGRDYLKRHEQQRQPQGTAPGELLGVSLNPQLREELQQLDLLKEPPRAGKILLLATQSLAGMRELAAGLQRQGQSVTLREAPEAADPHPTDLEEAFLSIALPAEMLRFASQELA
jgi:pimeloyl-ACP methyl ester carboxylesterase